MIRALALLLCFAPAIALGQVAHVQQGTTYCDTNASNNSCAISFGTDVTAGNYVLFAGGNWGGQGIDTLPSQTGGTCSLGTFVLAAEFMQQVDGWFDFQVYYAPVNVGGSCTVTATVSTGGFIFGTTHEVSGIAFPQNDVQTASENNSAALAIPSAAVTSTGGFWISVVGRDNGATPSPPAGWTLAGHASSNAWGASGYFVSQSSSAEASTWTWSSNAADAGFTLAFNAGAVTEPSDIVIFRRRRGY